MPFPFIRQTGNRECHARAGFFNYHRRPPTAHATPTSSTEAAPDPMFTRLHFLVLLSRFAMSGNGLGLSCSRGADQSSLGGPGYSSSTAQRARTLLLPPVEHNTLLERSSYGPPPTPTANYDLTTSTLSIMCSAPSLPPPAWLFGAQCTGRGSDGWSSIQC
ncbi:hypothetical protein FIBSPDRAFT_898901 [Athelia psychrophila]|uniref:Uncharacterized protein n=1 Tax=Athelia psychrophila TaxID=1759441 RepID=A0A166AF08_9AGAM|nr:hypothetical protein FIBSPDRAFT_898901 [Fibularhizoctonia sp. CBS 109695]